MGQIWPHLCLFSFCDNDKQVKHKIWLQMEKA